MQEFNEGDLVAVFGGEFDAKSQKSDSVTLCRIITVGHSDVLAEYDSGYTKSVHVVPKSICLKLSIEPEEISSAETLTPEIGDLVLSYVRHAYSSSESTTGIIERISYKLGRPDTCDILCGVKTETVSWSSLIVLKRH